MIKLRNFFDFLRFRPNLADFIRIASSLHLFDGDFPPFDPKASTFRRGPPPGPPEVPPEGRPPHEIEYPSLFTLHLFTPHLFTPRLFTPHIFTPRLFTPHSSHLVFSHLTLHNPSVHRDVPPRMHVLAFPNHRAVARWFGDCARCACMCSLSQWPRGHSLCIGSDLPDLAT